MLALTLAALAAIVVSGSLQAASGPYGQYTAQAATGELVAGSQAGQSFVTDQPGLYRIDVYLGHYQRPIRGMVRLHVTALPFAGPDLALATLDAAQVQTDGFESFEFAPLDEPAGQPLCFWLEAPQAQPDNALTVIGANSDSYPNGRAFFNNLPASGGVQDLTFRLYYQPGAGQALATVMQRLAAGRPAAFGAPQLYAILMAGYLLGAAALLALVVSRLHL